MFQKDSKSPQDIVAEYRRLVDLKPDFYLSYYYLGNALVEVGDWEGAIAAYRDAVSKSASPDFDFHYQCYYNLAEALLKTGRSNEAIEVLQKGIEIKPDYYKYYLLLAKALLQTENIEGAVSAYQQANDLTRNTDNCKKFNQEFRQLLVQLCRVLLQKEDTEGAIAAYQQAIELKVDEDEIDITSYEPELLFEMGVALVERGISLLDLERGEKALRKSLSLKPSLEEYGYFHLGKLESRRGCWANAAKHYHRFLEKVPQNLDAALGIAHAWEELGQCSKAAEQYRCILLEYGESSEVLFRLGRSLAKLQRWVEAIVEYRRSLALGFNTPQIHRYLADAFVQTHCWSKALEHWQLFLQTYPTAVTIQRQKFYTLMGLGRWIEAAQEWQKYWQQNLSPGSGEGQSVDFCPKQSAYGEIHDCEMLSLTGDLTIEFWMYLRAWPSNWTNIISKFETDQKNEFCLRLKNGKLGQWYYGDGNSSVKPLNWSPQDHLNLNEWNHIACVRKVNSYGRIYINGVLIAEKDWTTGKTASQTKSSIRIMGSPEQQRFQDGKLCELRIWKIVRSEEAIQEGIHQAKNNKELGLVGAWNFLSPLEGVWLNAVGEHHVHLVSTEDSSRTEKLVRVGICGWEVSQAAADQANAVVSLYQDFAEVEWFGCLFPTCKGWQMWQSIQESGIACHSIQIQDEELFWEEAIRLVLAHPYDVIHLCKPRMPNVILGILYKLLWDTRVIVDFDEKELAFAQTHTPIDLKKLWQSKREIPALKELTGKTCTRIAMGLSRDFDAVRAWNEVDQEDLGSSDVLAEIAKSIRLTNGRQLSGCLEVLLRAWPPISSCFNQAKNARIEASDDESDIRIVYRQAVDLNPDASDFGEFNLQLGQLLFQQGQFQEASVHLQKSIDIHCRDPKLFFNLAVALIESRSNLDQAEKALHRSVELDSSFSETACLYLGQLETQRERWEQAIGYYRRCLAINPQHVDAAIGIAQSLGQLGKWSEAVDEYRRILLEFGETGKVLFDLGRSLAKLQRWVEAVVEYRRSLTAGFDHPIVYHGLAEALVQLQHWPEAIEAWRSLLKTCPGALTIRRKLAYTLMGLGRWLEAAGEWKHYWEQESPGTGQGQVVNFCPEQATYGEIPHSGSFSLTGDLTIEFWLYLRSWPSTWTDLISKFKTDQENEFCLRLKDGEIGQWYYGDGTKNTRPLFWTPQDHLRLNEWNHISCVRKVSRYGRIYVNGVLIAEEDWTTKKRATLTEAPARIMGVPAQSQFQDGKLCELRIWQIARTEEDIQQGMYGAIADHEIGLVGAWNSYDSLEHVWLDVGGHHPAQIRMIEGKKRRPLRIGVLGWEESISAADRAVVLGNLYQDFAEVEWLGCLFPSQGWQVWEPIKNSPIPCNCIEVKDESRFLQEAIALVLSHPYDVVHLSKPRMPGIILGLLYKILWNAKVIVDLDEQELAPIQNQQVLDVQKLSQSQEKFLKLQDLTSKDSNRIALGLAREFDGVRAWDAVNPSEWRSRDALAMLVETVQGSAKDEWSDALSLLLKALPSVQLIMVGWGEGLWLIQQAQVALAKKEWSVVAHHWRRLFQLYASLLSVETLVSMSNGFFAIDAFTEAEACLERALALQLDHKGVLRSQSNQYYYHAYSSWLMEIVEDISNWYQVDGLLTRPSWQRVAQLCEALMSGKRTDSDVRMYVRTQLLLAEESWEQQNYQTAKTILEKTINSFGRGLSSSVIDGIVSAIDHARRNEIASREELNQGLQTHLSAIATDSLSVNSWLCLYDVLNWHGLLDCSFTVRQQAIQRAYQQGDVQSDQESILKMAVRAAIDQSDFHAAEKYLDRLATTTVDSSELAKLRAYKNLQKGDLQGFRNLWPRDNNTSVDVRFQKYIQGKSVAIVGPAPTGEEHGEEIDSFDVVIRCNYRGADKMPNPREYGTKTHISLYNAHTIRYLIARNQLHVLSDLDFCLIRRPRHDWDSLSWDQNKVRLIEENNCIFYKSLNAIPAILFDVLLQGASRVKLFKTNFYLSEQQHNEQYRGRSESDFVGFPLKKIQPLVANHDLVSQVSFVQNLWNRNFIVVNEQCTNMLGLSSYQYLSEMEKLVYPQRQTEVMNGSLSSCDDSNLKNKEISSVSDKNLENLEKLAALQPNQAENYLKLGNAYKDLNKRLDAIWAYHKAFLINPVLLENTHRNSKDSSILSFYLENIQKDLQVGDFYLDLSHILEQKGDYQEAINCYQYYLRNQVDPKEAEIEGYLLEHNRQLLEQQNYQDSERYDRLSESSRYKRLIFVIMAVPHKLVTALSVLRFQKDLKEYEACDDYLVLAGGNPQGIKILLEISKIWNFKKVISIGNEYNFLRSNKSKGMSNISVAQELIKKKIGLSSVDVVYHWSPTDDILWSLYAQSRKICFGDALGILKKHSITRRFKPNDKLVVDEAYLLAPYEETENMFRECPIKVVSPDPYQCIINDSVKMIKGLIEYCNNIKGQAISLSSSITFLPTSYLSQSPELKDFDKEMEIYLSYTLRYTSEEELIVVKAHPTLKAQRQSRVLVEKLEQHKRKCFEIDDCFDDVPLEFFAVLLKPKKLLAVLSTCSVSIAYLCKCDIVLGLDKTSLALFKDITVNNAPWDVKQRILYLQTKQAFQNSFPALNHLDVSNDSQFPQFPIVMKHGDFIESTNDTLSFRNHDNRKCGGSYGLRHTAYSFYKLGEYHAALGNYDLALSEIKKSIELDLSNPYFYYRQAKILVNSGNRDDARPLYLKATELNFFSPIRDAIVSRQSSEANLRGLVFINSKDKPPLGMNKSIQIVASYLAKHHGIHLEYALSQLDNVLEVMANRLHYYDFIIFNSAASLSAWNYPGFGRLIAKLTIPTFIYWHETEWTLSRWIQDYPIAHQSILEKSIHANLAHLTVAEVGSKTIQEYYGQGRKINIYKIHECTDIPKDIQLVSKPLATTTPFVLNVASIQERKGTDLFVETAIQVCQKHPTVKFIWLGKVVSFAQEFYENCHTRIRSVGLENRILFPGHVDSPWEYYLRNASVFFLSSRDDPFPLSMLEAMCTGRNIVAFNVGGTPEALGGYGKVIAPFDIDAASDGIIDLLNSSENVNEDLIQRYQKMYTPEMLALRVSETIRPFVLKLKNVTEASKVYHYL